MSIKVDEWGNCWDPADEERKHPVWPHPELLPEQATCSTCGKYVWRSQEPDGSFLWRCGCGRTFPGLHH